MRTAASKLLNRLGTAGRLSSGAFVGTASDATKVEAMFATMRRLDAAYVVYRKRMDQAPANTAAAEAAATLEADIAEATANQDLAVTTAATPAVRVAPQGAAEGRE